MNSYSYITHLGASRKNFRGIVSACEGLRRSARKLENASGGLYKRTTRRFRVGGGGGIPTRRVWNDEKAIHGPRQAILARCGEGMGGICTERVPPVADAILRPRFLIGRRKCNIMLSCPADFRARHNKKQRT